jgi:uncharacterized BrkB/YihY/UPF0761 family membrane protein
MNVLPTYRDVTKEVAMCWNYNITAADGHRWRQGSGATIMSEEAVAWFFTGFTVMCYAMIMFCIAIYNSTSHVVNVTQEKFEEWRQNFTGRKLIGLIAIYFFSTLFTFGIATVCIVYMLIKLQSDTFDAQRVFGALVGIGYYFISCVFILYWVVIGCIACSKKYKQSINQRTSRFEVI